MLHKLKKIDVPIIVILLAFLVISTMLVYSATLNSRTIAFEPKKIIIIYIVSIIAFLVTTLIDYRILTKVSFYLYGFGVFLLIAVLLFGEKIGGARGWFSLPIVKLDFQPVELFKIILILTLAMFIARRKGEPLELLRDVVPIGLITFFPVVLVTVQPDLGNAMILVVILCGMYWIGNMKLSNLLIGALVIAGAAYLFLYLFQHYHTDIQQFFQAQKWPTHWMDRINTFISPETASKDDKWQVNNAIRAIGSGSLIGEGYLNGSSVHSNRIPVVYTDAIFVVVGEEFGFVGASVLLLLYFVLIYRMILISIYCNHLAGTYIIIGIVSMMVFQIFENISMWIGIMPVTGITLPFISYGGTSLLINMIAMGLVMSVRLHDDKLLEDE
ncbi:FtsW/RodA/SpoVE family cell cycle protein [Paenibacillus tyrfis]|uniref:Cell cycle protein n=1 Tax=Paenibacillus tyrfis TaxID=1501230 RepID=A0A081NVV1_9BACL|nr:FtsW/RodA/SpoVE family cell cycle protein [Paenibacillus tyrfis]KEQ22574.1 cell cycle protein [Paenibacillus tyrfis]